MDKNRAQELLEIVRNGYNNIASDFNSTRKKALWPKIYELMPLVKDGDRVLDLACGNGRLLEALSNKQINYLGVDNSVELLSIARRNYPNNNFIVSDMLSLDNVGAGEFNCIFCLAALQHIPSREFRLQALKNMSSKLADGGVLILSNWNLWTKPDYRRHLISRYIKRFFNFYQDDWNDLLFSWKTPTGEEKSCRYYHAFTTRELRRLAIDAELKPIKITKDDYNFWLIYEKIK